MRLCLILAGCLAIFPTMANGQGKELAMGRPIVSSQGVAHFAAPRGVPVNPWTRVVGGVDVPHGRANGTVVRATPVRETQRNNGSGNNSFRNNRTRNDGLFTTISPTIATTMSETELEQDFIPVPGLGFDMVHVAATRGRGTSGSRSNAHGFVGVVPFFDGGFFLPSQREFIEEPSAEDVPQSTVDDRRRLERRRTAEPITEEVTVTTPVTSMAAEREVEQFVFVRRDGTVFFAVAYTWEDGVLRYITSQGLRKSVTRNDLDLDATQKFNEQRGLNFRRPA